MPRTSKKHRRVSKKHRRPSKKHRRSSKKHRRVSKKHRRVSKKHRRVSKKHRRSSNIRGGGWFSFGSRTNSAKTSAPAHVTTTEPPATVARPETPATVVDPAPVVDPNEQLVNEAGKIQIFTNYDAAAKALEATNGDQKAALEILKKEKIEDKIKELKKNIDEVGQAKEEEGELIKDLKNKNKELYEFQRKMQRGETTEKDFKKGIDGLTPENRLRNQRDKIERELNNVKLMVGNLNKLKEEKGNLENQLHNTESKGKVYSKLDSKLDSKSHSKLDSKDKYSKLDSKY